MFVLKEIKRSRILQAYRCAVNTNVKVYILHNLTPKYIKKTSEVQSYYWVMVANHDLDIKSSRVLAVVEHEEFSWYCIIRIDQCE